EPLLDSILMLRSVLRSSEEHFGNFLFLPLGCTVENKLEAVSARIGGAPFSETSPAPLDGKREILISDWLVGNSSSRRIAHVFVVVGFCVRVSHPILYMLNQRFCHAIENVLTLVVGPLLLWMLFRSGFFVTALWAEIISSARSELGHMEMF